MRKFLGILAGLAALIVVVWVVEAIGHSIWPPPSGTDLSDPAQLATLLDKIPFAAKLAVAAAWFLGAMAGAWAANAVARWAPAGWIVVAIGIAFGVATLFMIPHPLWMQIAAVAAPLLGGWIGLRLPRPPGPA